MIAAGFANGAIPTTGPLQIKHLRSARCKKWCNNGSLICVRSSGRHNRLGVLAGVGSSRRKAEPRKTRTARNGGSKPQLLATKGHNNSNHGIIQNNTTAARPVGLHGKPMKINHRERREHRVQGGDQWSEVSVVRVRFSQI